MKKSRLLGSASACVAGLLLSHPVWASPVTVTSNFVVTVAVDDGASGDIFNGTTIPSTYTYTAAFNHSSNTTNLN